MVSRGINVCVGTDSLASNETLSILDELRHVRQAAPDVPANSIIEMGTIRGAKGLGLERQLGSLEPGKLADFAAIPWDPDGPRDPALNLLDGNRAPSAVWIGGRQVHDPA
jgi:cytosine/adenosine deaminase-related metal-dependent hydrolase